MLRLLILTLSLFLAVQTFAGTAAVSPTSIKGFHEWKNEKIQTAMSQISMTRGQIFKAQMESNKKTAENLEKQVDQLKWNLDVARDLSVTDYFVLYLSQISQADRFTQAAAKLSTKEVAELMEAYANTLSSSNPSEVVVRPGATPGIRGKLPVQAIQVRDQVK